MTYIDNRMDDTRPKTRLEKVVGHVRTQAFSKIDLVRRHYAELGDHMPGSKDSFILRAWNLDQHAHEAGVLDIELTRTELVDLMVAAINGIQVEVAKQEGVDAPKPVTHDDVLRDLSNLSSQVESVTDKVYEHVPAPALAIIAIRPNDNQDGDGDENTRYVGRGRVLGTPVVLYGKVPEDCAQAFADVAKHEWGKTRDAEVKGPEVSSEQSNNTTPESPQT
jgi:hypothetical protein